MKGHVKIRKTMLYLYQVFSPLIANYNMGATSSLIDNVPLTAALLKANISLSVSEWMLLTYTLGVGDSLLVIGSAAGIVNMSNVKGLSFAR